MTPKEKAPAPLAPEESVNSGLTAIPESHLDAEIDAFDYGPMNEADARASGYTDENGRAVEKARQNIEGHPTGAYTDIGAGRSSVTRLTVH